MGPRGFPWARNITFSPEQFKYPVRKFEIKGGYVETLSRSTCFLFGAFGLCANPARFVFEPLALARGEPVAVVIA